MKAGSFLTFNPCALKQYSGGGIPRYKVSLEKKFFVNRTEIRGKNDRGTIQRYEDW